MPEQSLRRHSGLSPIQFDWDTTRFPPHHRWQSACTLAAIECGYFWKPYDRACASGSIIYRNYTALCFSGTPTGHYCIEPDNVLLPSSVRDHSLECRPILYPKRFGLMAIFMRSVSTAAQEFPFATEPNEIGTGVRGFHLRRITRHPKIESAPALNWVRTCRECVTSHVFTFPMRFP